MDVDRPSSLPSPLKPTQDEVITVDSSPDSSLSEATSTSSQASSQTMPAPRAKRRLTEEGDPSTLPSPPTEKVTPFQVHVAEVEQAVEKLTKFLVWHAKIIEDLEQGRDIIDQLLEKKLPVAVDCEGVNLGDRVNGKVTLVQLGDMDGEVYLFDVQVQAGLAGELKRLLETPDVVKIMHDCRSDSEGLYHQFKIKLKNVFDTQAAHQVLQKSSGVEKVDKSSGLEKVCRTYGGPGSANPFKDTVKGVYKKNQNFWSTRPLTELMISYSASDVLCLVPKVYHELNRLISSDEDKALFAELCEAHINPPVRDKSEKKKQYDKNRKRGGGHGHGLGPGGRNSQGYISQVIDHPSNIYHQHHGGSWHHQEGYYPTEQNGYMNPYAGGPTYGGTSYRGHSYRGRRH